MKKYLWLVFASVLLASCASFPKPDADQSCLMVGNFILDFPDGFFSEAPRKITHTVQMNIIDLDENKPLRAVTSLGGYYYFVGKPGHNYVIQTWEARIDQGNGSFAIFGPYKFGLAFTAMPGKVNNLQNILYTYRLPKRRDEIGHHVYWDFKIDASLTSDPDGIRDFIKAKQRSDGGWLDYEIELPEFKPLK